jgi:hypothetical protein
VDDLAIGEARRRKSPELEETVRRAPDRPASSFRREPREIQLHDRLDRDLGLAIEIGGLGK